MKGVCKLLIEEVKLQSFFKHT